MVEERLSSGLGADWVRVVSMMQEGCSTGCRKRVANAEGSFAKYHHVIIVSARLKE